MAYVIAEPCVDVKDTACVDVCPVDCIHTKDGENQLYINPTECIDCAACEPACPVAAIFILDDVPEQWTSYTELNEKFFEDFVKPTKAGAAAGEDGAAAADEDRLGIEEFVQTIESPTSSIRPIFRPFVMFSQLVLGAFDAKFKRELEEMAQNPIIFSAAVSTGINSLINLTLYPLVLFLLFSGGNIESALFTGKGNFAIFLGVVLAILEGLYRFRDDLTTTDTEESSRYGASIYGWIPSLIARVLLPVLRPVIATEPASPRSTMPGAVLTNGPIYQEDVRERYRRYGMLNRLEEKVDRYIIEIEFPRWVPDSAYKRKYNLPDRMPDYTYQVNLGEGTVTSEAKLEDPRFTEFVGRTSSFPLGFSNMFRINGQPENFQAMLRDKVLQIIVPKSGKVEDLVIERPVHYAKIKG
jgi:NAD-dependent dihydropyrimidine dehydrogenase PreA subunit